MTQLPNVITLLSSDVTEVMFWIIYGLCGISDIADGWLARRLKCVTKKGALLDSLADICFVATTEMQSTLCANNCREW